jgi:hypothetical protein
MAIKWPTEVKGIAMTDEYAANFFATNGYMAARVDALKTERELREQIAQEIEAICDCQNSALVCVHQQAVRIAKGK